MQRDTSVEDKVEQMKFGDCWAACTGMIVNYTKEKNYTTEEIYNAFPGVYGMVIGYIRVCDPQQGRVYVYKNKDESSPNYGIYTMTGANNHNMKPRGWTYVQED